MVAVLLSMQLEEILCSSLSSVFVDWHWHWREDRRRNGVRQQKDSRIREETDRKIKKRRESRAGVRKLALCLSSYCYYLTIVIVLLSFSLFSLLSSSLSAETTITLPAECEGASFPPDGTHSTWCNHVLARLIHSCSTERLESRAEQVPAPHEDLKVNVRSCIVRRRHT